MVTFARESSGVVNIQDNRGWRYRYSHLHSIDPAIKVGVNVEMGQRVGMLGKKGGSGGWSHLHFDIWGPVPGRDSVRIDAYAPLFEAYVNQNEITLQAVARPHHLSAFHL